MKVHKMSSEQARMEWRTLLDLASQDDVDIVIERHGKATAAVIGYEAYLAIQSTLAEIRTGGPSQKRGQRMATVLEQLSQLPERTPIADPLTWQREQRQDRTLPVRDD
jgi:PHD/YefM family antitoxin component YafN of YafNO toxin-antitoxin module